MIMKKFKSLIINILIVIIFTVTFALAGCGGTYVPPSGGGNPALPKPPGGSTAGSSRDFTVKLDFVNGNPSGFDYDALTVTWNDGESMPVKAKFGEDGVAKVSGLDGSYRVTIDGLPNNYTYDPNTNWATNLNKNIEVEVFRVITARPTPGHDGSTVNNALQLKSEGAYRYEVNSYGDTCYYYYKPAKQGAYTVRSLASIDENVINPKYRKCNGDIAGGMVWEEDLIDGNGASSTYTVNFDETSNFDSTNIGSTMIFGVTGESRGLGYPITIEFILKRVDDYAYDDLTAPIAVPTEFERVTSGEISKEDFKAEKDALMRQGTNGVLTPFSQMGHLRDDLVGFNENDGYYHLLDTNGKPNGAVVCAYISSPCSVFVTPEGADSFVTIEYHGNKALTIDDNYEKYSQNFYPDIESPYDDMDYHFINYKIFIEGYSVLLSHDKPNDFPGISDQYKEYANTLGYHDLTNADGVYPVTKELQRFLQGYATNARLFMDGNGVAESSGLTATERSQWLFACCYYA